MDVAPYIPNCILIKIIEMVEYIGKSVKIVNFSEEKSNKNVFLSGNRFILTTSSIKYLAIPKYARFYYYIKTYETLKLQQ